ncbi:MAG: nucleoside-diphosphate sugar epimerase/dehydratase [Gemmatimonadaceae bacterium]
MRNRTLLLFDILLLLASTLIAYAVRFEGWGWLSTPHATTAFVYLLVTVPLRIVIYLRVGLYRRVWEQASISEMEALLTASLAGAAVTMTIGLSTPFIGGLQLVRVPLSVLALDALLTGAGITLARYLIRWGSRRSHTGACHDGRRVLIAGAGSAGQLMAREIYTTPALGLTPVGFVDDDSSKHRRLVERLPVLGSLADIPKIVAAHNVEEIIIAMPSAPGKVIGRVVRAAESVKVATRTIPGLYEILSGRVNLSALRSVEIQDLLRRAPIETDIEAIRPIIKNQTILVTGAGGSIGSEICRQIARLMPSRLVLLGHGENSIFEIWQELRESHPTLCMTPVIADVRDRRRMHRVVAEYAPNAIFHAAAHKHVPLMELNVADAVSNNVIGTRNTVEAAERAGTPYFVLISSDKAVQPSSVMGATKRVAEQVVQLAGARTGRAYVSVRFGNVLGSRGSVIPTFLSQMRQGGPVTVTHPDMCRFFITIPEAVQLVLQACALSRRGEVFMLDMGEPVRIVDLASDLIRLSGLQVGTDIEIRFTGMRPGEKLFEEMFSQGEEVMPTPHPKVLRARQAELAPGIPVRLEALVSAIDVGVTDMQLRRLLRHLVPDFTGLSSDVALAASESDVPVHVERTVEVPLRPVRERMVEAVPPSRRFADATTTRRAAGDA